ncbi:hypothetical protein V8E55_008458 [Tylopilus felleus]
MPPGGEGQRREPGTSPLTAMFSLSQFIHNINQSAYRLDTIGVVGLFGGDTAINALETTHFYVGQRWAGWYNYPGGMTVAMRFGQIARSRLWDTIFPGPDKSSTHIFNLTGKSGPAFFEVFTGTTLVTGYLGYLIAEQCMKYSGTTLPLFRKDGGEARSSLSPGVVTIMRLSEDRVRTRNMDSRTTRHRKVMVTMPRSILRTISTTPISNSDLHLALWSIVPSLVSILACVFSFLGHDPLCASLILLGILSSGFSSLVLGSATLGIHAVVPSAERRGDGLMFPADGSIIVLKGGAPEVGIITERSEFKPEYASWVLSDSGAYHTIGVSSLLLVAQVFVQFILLPRCTFFGQILALISFLTSSAYHLYVVSVSADREGLHRKVLLDILSRKHSLRMEKWYLGTTTQTAVFVCLVLGEDYNYPDSLETKPDAIMTRITHNDTPVWRHWRGKVVKELDRFWMWNAVSLPYVPSIQLEPENQTEVDEYSRFTEGDKELLGYLVDDAWCVFSRYPKWRNGEPVIESRMKRVDELEDDGPREGGDRDEEDPNTCPGGSPAECAGDHHERHTPLPNKVPV